MHMSSLNTIGVCIGDNENLKNFNLTLLPEDSLFTKKLYLKSNKGEIITKKKIYENEPIVLNKSGIVQRKICSV